LTGLVGKATIHLGSDGVMTLRQPRKKLVKGLNTGLFLSLCLSRLGLLALFLLFLTIRFYGPPSGLLLVLAGFTEPA
jgi:hypothetical protein